MMSQEQQTEVKDVRMVDEIWNTVYVAVLEVDDSISNLIVILFYDYKPVCFISSIIPQIE